MGDTSYKTSLTFLFFLNYVLSSDYSINNLVLDAAEYSL